MSRPCTPCATHSPRATPRRAPTWWTEALNISRGTLREALRQLQHEGLVEAGERGRLMARTLHDHGIAQIFQVRAALEGLAAELLCHLEDRSEVVAELTTALQAMINAADDVHKLVETDMDFHRRLCELSGNTALVQNWDMLAGAIRMSIMVAGVDRAVSNMAVPRNQNILDAVRDGDAERARAIVTDHMQGAADNVTNTPFASGSASPETAPNSDSSSSS